MKRRSFLGALAAILVAPKYLAQAPGTTAQTIVLKDVYGIVGLGDMMESSSLERLSSSTYARWNP